MFCITSDNLYTVDPMTGRATLVGRHGVRGANALTFLADGTLALAGDNAFYRLSRSSGAATRVGTVGSLYSSGDLSGTPAGPLYLTASGGDRLVQINPVTGAGTIVGSIGVLGVYGLAYWDGALYGFTSNGQIIQIRLSDGVGTEVARAAGTRFEGAAVNQRLWY